VREEKPMLDTPVVNVAIGLVFCFAAMALAASTVTEALASLVKLRANTLVSGIQKMLNDPKFDGLALQIYNHALVHPQGSGGMQSRSRFWSYSGPSYIRSANFATAAVDVLQKIPGDKAQLITSIDALGDEQLKQLLKGMVVRAAGDMEHLRKQIADWFDSSMDRVSGAYKRQAQLISFVIGFGLAAAFNVDATHVVAALWANPTMAKAVANQASPLTSSNPDLKQTMEKLQSLPVGAGALGRCDGRELWCVGGRAVIGLNLAGWLITAVAAVFGAPFWFDLLSKLVQLRGAGPKPASPSAAKTGN
jgi:hypothetical protein